MATMLSEVYDALIAAGAPEDKARKAAEAIVGYDSRFSGLESTLTNQFSKLGNDFTTLRGDVNLLRWMVGFNIALVVAVLFKVFAS